MTLTFTIQAENSFFYSDDNTIGTPYLTHSSPHPAPNPERQLPNLPNLPTYLSSPSTCPGYRDILALQHLEDKALYVKGQAAQAR